MNALALRAPHILALGAGGCGIELGLKLVMPSARIVGYVEREIFAAANLAAKIEEGVLDEAPIWSDVETFDGSRYHGHVDIVSIGLPCQSFSTAGKRKGIKDERWLWPEVWRIICQVEPRYLFLEEVRGFVQSGFSYTLRDLASSGWSAEWDLFSAAAVGAPHKRERFFLLAYASIKSERKPNDTTSTKPWQKSRSSSGRGSSKMDNSMCSRRRNAKEEICSGWNAPFPPGPADIEAWRQVLAIDPSLEPAICRTSDGMANRLEQLRLCGNGVVPLVAAVAWSVLGERLGEV